MSCHPRVTEWTTIIHTHLPHLTKDMVKIISRIAFTVVSLLRIRFWIKEDSMECIQRYRREDARFFGWLSEKDRRRYAAVEAANWAWRGRVHRAGLGVHPKTIRQGLHDLEEAEDAAAGRIRNGGGRPQRVVAQPTLEANLRQLLQVTAGDPMREGVLWTNLSLRELSRRLLALGTPASRAQSIGCCANSNWAAARRGRKRRWATTLTATPSSKHRAPAAIEAPVMR